MDCQVCETELENHGAISHGDGDISDEYGCPICDRIWVELHAIYCECDDCQSGVSKEHWLDAWDSIPYFDMNI